MDAVQDKLISVEEIAVAVRFVGTVGATVSPVGGDSSFPRIEKVDGLFWVLYSVPIQQAERAVFEIRGSSSLPSRSQSVQPVLAAMNTLLGELYCDAGIEVVLELSSCPFT